jgi:polyisoprenoid-binding protein YceI
MKTRIWSALLALAMMSMAAVAGDSYVLKSHSMKIDGTSTFHDWMTPVGTVKAKADLTVSGSDITEVKAMWVQGDVKSITSDKGETMVEKIQEAFKVEEGHKTITFNMTSLKELKKTGNSYTIVADGNLAMAGSKKPITLTVTGTVKDNEVTFTGEYKLKMTNWGMERPTAMLGTIKCADDVKITFSITLVKK